MWPGRWYTTFQHIKLKVSSTSTLSLLLWHITLLCRMITPKLTLYVCRENSTVFNAIFLSAFNCVELLQKLASLHSVPQDQVRDIYMQGPQSIHIQMNNDVLRHLKEESMFTFEIVQENGGYIFVLKPNGKWTPERNLCHRECVS